MTKLINKKIGIIGLGYVGLPLSVEFGKKRSVLGFDKNKKRIEELNNNFDSSSELSEDLLEEAVNLKFSSNIKDLKDCGIFIITVPTPVDLNNKPDLEPLKEATREVANFLKEGNLVIYESTVYPGATEEVCVPILEEVSQLKYNQDFYCGYSPERINPGDKEHSLRLVKKITSGSNDYSADVVDQLYSEIIDVGTYRTESIKVAEAAKVIENTQRDVNIAFVNELVHIFKKMDLDTTDVLKAAKTKWNFLDFTPGLVGGHCIGVDPYYLTFKAKELGYNPQIITSGRKINDGMGEFVATDIKNELLKRDINISKTRALILGLSFKENCRDIRNTKVIDLASSLEDMGIKIQIFDPWVDKEDAKNQFSIECLEELPNKAVYDLIVLAVAHEQFLEMGVDSIRSLIVPGGLLYDLKSVFPKEKVDGRM
jgi:UDP-N-acetyl-D-galactosamine dehydrogenase